MSRAIRSVVTAQQASRYRAGKMHEQAGERVTRLCAVALLEFLLAAARARVVAANVFQAVTHGFLVCVTAMRAMDMTVLMGVVVFMLVIAVGAVDVFLLGHACYSGM